MKLNIEKKKKLSLNLEKLRSQIMFTHDMNKVHKAKFYAYSDPIYDIREMDAELDKPEKKVGHPLLDYLRDNPQPMRPQNQDGIIDETSQKRKEFEVKLNIKFYDARWKWYLHTKLNQMKTLSQEIQESIETEEKICAHEIKRINFMHNQLSHDNDKQRVRDVLAREMHKKATMQDIGEVLDQMIIDEKIQNPDEENINPKSLTQDYMSYDLYDTVKNITHANKIKPNLYEDQDRIVYDKDYMREEKYKEIIEKVNAEDIKRDHTIDTLTDLEKLELQIYSTIKKDPYYKHYIFNWLRYESEYRIRSCFVPPKQPTFS